MLRGKTKLLAFVEEHLLKALKENSDLVNR
jgi:hypothetical protein